MQIEVITDGKPEGTIVLKNGKEISFEMDEVGGKLRVVVDGSISMRRPGPFTREGEGDHSPQAKALDAVP